jgi:hypothetical protein
MRGFLISTNQNGKKYHVKFIIKKFLSRLNFTLLNTAEKANCSDCNDQVQSNRRDADYFITA